MTYELAKQLKDAGFPHNWCKDMETGICEGTSECYPALEELIAACGEDFGALTPPTTGLEWIAWDTLPLIALMENGSKSITGSNGCTGKTPDEAVANLWLALNSKL